MPEALSSICSSLPATACLAVSIYTKLSPAQGELAPILVGCAVGSPPLWAVSGDCSASFGWMRP